MATQPHSPPPRPTQTPPPRPSTPTPTPTPHPTPTPTPSQNPSHPPGSQAPAQAPTQAELEQKALDELRHPKNFKLAEQGSRDYVAGQPVDEKELTETASELDKRVKAAHDAKLTGGSTHQKFASQYGDPEKK